MSAPFNGAKALLDADSGDIDFLFLGDSTGETDSEWVGHFMWLLHMYYPSFTVSYSEWYNGGSLSWTTPTTIHAGSGSNTVRIWCAGDAGAGCDYYTDREVAIIQHPTDVDFCTIALGHNTTRGETDFNALVEMVESNWPSAHITMVKQNPRYDNFSLGEATAATVGTVASTYDTGLVDIRSVFLTNPDPRNNLMGDDIHPNAVGRRVWGEAMWLSLYPQGGYSLASLDTAVLLLQAKNYSGSGNWLDESGNGLDATITGATFVDGGNATLGQSHFRMGGGGNYMVISDNAALDFDASTSWTVMVVGMVDDANRAYPEVWLDKGSFTGTSQGGFALHRDNAQTYIKVGSHEAGVGGETDTAGTILDNTLHVFAGRHDKAANELAAFLDGVKSTSPQGASDRDNTNTEALTIGARTNPRNYGYMTGRLVAVAIWDVALSDSEIASLGTQLSSAGKKRIASLFAPVARW